MAVESTPAIAGAAACLPAQGSHRCSSLTLCRPGGGRPRIACIQRVAVTAPLLNRATRTLLARGPPSQPNAFRRSNLVFLLIHLHSLHLHFDPLYVADHLCLDVDHFHNLAFVNY